MLGPCSLIPAAAYLFCPGNFIKNDYHRDDDGQGDVPRRPGDVGALAAGLGAMSMTGLEAYQESGSLYTHAAEPTAEVKAPIEAMTMPVSTLHYANAVNRRKPRLQSNGTSPVFIQGQAQG